MVEAPTALADGYIRRAISYAQAGKWDDGTKALAVIATLPKLADPKYDAFQKLFATYADAAQKIATATRGADVAALADLPRRDAERWKVLQPVLADVLQKRIASLAATQPAAADDLRKAGEALFVGRKFPLPVQSTQSGKDVGAGAATQGTGTGDTPSSSGSSGASTGASGSTSSSTSAGTSGGASVATRTGTAAGTGASAATTTIVDAPAAGPIERADGRKLPYCSPTTPKGKLCAGVASDDATTSGMAPLMVVMQVNGRPVAIMNTEVSNQDFARFCAVRSCSVPAASKLPVTTVSVRDAEAYADWLSGPSKTHYRLPNDAEWQVAAANITDVNNVNCSFGGFTKDLKTGIKDVGAAGVQNDLKLRDILGNVREWVGTAGAYRARGGAVDELREEVCMKNPSVPHDGKPDGKTGFRLVRELP